MSNIVERMANIDRRLRGLKAPRNIDISQFDLLAETWPFAFSLVKRPDPGWFAEFQITIICGGDPIVDVGVDDMPINNTKISTSIAPTISGNTLNVLLRVFNLDTVNGYSLNMKVCAYALNGISATCVRTV